MSNALSSIFPQRVSAVCRLARTASFGNAGRTYNTGNWIALGAAFVAALAEGAGARGSLAPLGGAFFGSVPALLVTAGSLAFFLGGARYDAAYQGPTPPRASALTQGHALSGLGAGLVALGLAGLSATSLETLTALCGGAIHALGKIGSATCEAPRVWKWLPLASRPLSLASLLAGLGAAPSIAQSATVILMIVSMGVWARADAMLLSDEQARSFAALLGLDRRVLGQPA